MLVFVVFVRPTLVFVVFVRLPMLQLALQLVSPVLKPAEFAGALKPMVLDRSAVLVLWVWWGVLGEIRVVDVDATGVDLA